MDISEYQDGGNAAAVAAEWGVDVNLLEELDGKWEIHEKTSGGAVIAYYVEFDRDVARDLLDALGVPSGEYSRPLSLHFASAASEGVPSVTGEDDGFAKRISDFLDQGSDVDWMLAWVIAHVENLGVELGITLNVGGSTITGTLISGRKYFERTRASLERAQTKQARLAHVLPNSLTQWIGLYSEPSAEADLYAFRPKYIHLDNARYLFGNSPLVPSNGTLWRGKVEAVDGFSLGQMQTA